jgi:hypothetical protein
MRANFLSMGGGMDELTIVERGRGWDSETRPGGRCHKRALLSGQVVVCAIPYWPYDTQMRGKTVANGQLAIVPNIAIDDVRIQASKGEYRLTLPFLYGF